MLMSYSRICKLWVLPLMMFESQQGLCSCKFVLHVSEQWKDNIKKIVMTGSINPFNW